MQRQSAYGNCMPTDARKFHADGNLHAHRCMHLQISPGKVACWVWRPRTSGEICRPTAVSLTQGCSTHSRDVAGALVAALPAGSAAGSHAAGPHKFTIRVTGSGPTKGVPALSTARRRGPPRQPVLRFKKGTPHK
eukprot:352478-Chlamydomonas_euryale.AAC.3